jgi:hypothetical protein
MTANALQAVLDKAAREETSQPAQPATPRKAPKPANAAPKTKAAPKPAAEAAPAKFFRPSRDNRRFVGGHFEPIVGKQLRMIAVEDDTTVQALLEEALDLLFVKKGRQKIADLSK